MTAANIERLIERGHVDEPNEPAALRFSRFGPKSPFAREWNSTANGRVCRVHRDDASVWLAISDQIETANMAVFGHRTPWLEILQERQTASGVLRLPRSFGLDCRTITAYRSSGETAMSGLRPNDPADADVSADW